MQELGSRIALEEVRAIGVSGQQHGLVVLDEKDEVIRPAKLWNDTSTQKQCDAIMNAWDCGPFPPILAEAGGYFGDWSGNPTILGSEALSTNSLLLPEVLTTVNQRDSDGG